MSEKVSRDAVEELIGKIMTGHMPVLATRDMLRALLAANESLAKDAEALRKSNEHLLAAIQPLLNGGVVIAELKRAVDAALAASASAKEKTP